MAAVTSGIWNHAAQITTPLGGAKAMDDQSGSSSTDGSTISANDFLTLLVTEMQNQDPTADTDPNEYINQLVNVNSLEQLISINQTLSTAMSGTSEATPSADSQKTSSAHAPTSVAAVHGTHSSATSVASGNLSTPEANPSALRVARALDHPRITR